MLAWLAAVAATFILVVFSRWLSGLARAEEARLGREILALERAPVPLPGAAPRPVRSRRAG